MVSPRRPSVRIWLNMKLQSICSAPKPETLKCVYIWLEASSTAPSGKCERVAVPMEYRQDIAEIGEERILLACLGQGY